MGPGRATFCYSVRHELDGLEASSPHPSGFLEVLDADGISSILLFTSNSYVLRPRPLDS